MHRKKYDKLLIWKRKSTKPLILLGARQVGKTYLLKDFAQTEYPDFHYFNFEEDKALARFFEDKLQVSEIIQNLEIYQDKAIARDHLIIFDEIQECPRALTALKYFAESEEDNRYQVAAAGSLLGLHLNSESFPVGKVDFEFLYPMSFEEFLRVAHPFLYEKYQNLDLQNYPIAFDEKLQELLQYYLYIGGLPEVVKFFSENPSRDFSVLEGVRKLQKNILLSYLADFAKHSGKENSMHLEKTWSECARQIGMQQDGKIKRFYFKNVISTKKQYSEFSSLFNWLEKAGLIIKCKQVEVPLSPLKSYAKDNLFKAYLFDVGMLGAMLDISPKEVLDNSLGTFKGFFVENFFAQSLTFLGHQDLHYYQHKTMEIDFLLNDSRNGILPLEVKSGKNTRFKSLLNYKEKYSPAQLLLFRQGHYEQQENLLKLPLWAAEKWAALSWESLHARPVFN